MGEGEREAEGFGTSRGERGGERARETGLESPWRQARATRGAARPSTRPAATASSGNEPAQLWDIKGVSSYLQIPVSSIYKMTAKNAAVRIPHIRIGGHLRFKPSDIDAWLTLLTVSNLEVLRRMHRAVSENTYGDHPQEKTG